MLRISNLNFAATYFLDTCGAFARRPPISKSYDENEALWISTQPIDRNHRPIYVCDRNLRRWSKVLLRRHNNLQYICLANVTKHLNSRDNKISKCPRFRRWSKVLFRRWSKVLLRRHNNLQFICLANVPKPLNSRDNKISKCPFIDDLNAGFL